MEHKIKVVTAMICLGFFLMVPVLAILQQGDPELVEAMPEGQGKQMVASICSGCHTLGSVLTQRRSSEEWAQTVNEMISRGAQIFPEEVDTMVSYLGEHFGAQAGSASLQSAGEEIFRNKCFQCHGEGMWSDLRQDRRGWEGTLFRMVGRGALWTEEEISSMADYLVETHGPQ
ncbi:MAG: c-type cytochrome [Acidobacteria bacterium]|nr:c-type cytochrome [Acidobacteriota bacterium]